MNSDPNQLVKRIRHLNLALIVSGAINIGVLSLLLYWVLRERPPIPYCELRPARSDQQQISLADQRETSEVLAQLMELPFSELIGRLNNTRIVENGFAERDLALAYLMAFHHFDIQRALPQDLQPQQQRFLSWKSKEKKEPISLVVYSDISQKQFDALLRFTKTERWPFTAEGLFILLKAQKEKNAIDENLVETFALTPEFWTVELLFNRLGRRASKQEILALLLEGNWEVLMQFVDQQRRLHDPSDARRQKFLLDYIQLGSPSAACLLLKTEGDFAFKKLNDNQVIALLRVVPKECEEGASFAQEMLASPRSSDVWKEASLWLYSKAGEEMPQNWSLQTALARFAPGRVVSDARVVSEANVKSKSEEQAIVKPVVSRPANRVVTAASIPAVPSISSTVSPKVYTVQEGDSLWKIAKKFRVKIADIKKINDLKSDKLKPGVVLKIPNSAESR